MGVAIGLARQWLNIHSVYPSISLTAHQILYGCCNWISQTVTEYSLSVPIDQPNSTSNIVWVLQWDQPNSDSILTRCTYRSAWHHIQYRPGVAVGLARQWLNIDSVYHSVGLTAHQILSGCCSRISWTVTEYSLSVGMGQPDSTFNTFGCFHRISRTASKYSLSAAMGQPDSTSNIACWCCRISRILTEYWLGVLIGRPDTPFNIE